MHQIGVEPAQQVAPPVCKTAAVQESGAAQHPSSIIARPDLLVSEDVVAGVLAQSACEGHYAQLVRELLCSEGAGGWGATTMCVCPLFCM